MSYLELQHDTTLRLPSVAQLPLGHRRFFLLFASLCDLTVLIVLCHSRSCVSLGLFVGSGTWCLSVRFQESLGLWHNGSAKNVQPFTEVETGNYQLDKAVFLAGPQLLCLLGQRFMPSRLSQFTQNSETQLPGCISVSLSSTKQFPSKNPCRESLP